MVGLDTGFFVGLMKEDQRTIDVWQGLAGSDSLPVVSMLTLGELLYIAFRTGKPDAGVSLVDHIDASSNVVSPDRPIIEKAAALKAGRSIPYIDAIILATFMLAGCKTIHTTDRNHFSEIKNKGISFIFY